jgi:hypothetical protein
MPISQELLERTYNPDVSYDFYKQLIDNPQLRAWSAQNGLRTYMEFLLLNPAWSLEYFLSSLDDAFSLNRQIYFNQDEKTNVIYDFGDLLHPKSASVIWVVLAELAVFGFVAAKGMHRGTIGLFIFFCTLFMGVFLIAFVVIHGDTGALPRHAIGAVMPLRLMLWILPPLILDAHGLQVGARVATR